MKLLVLAIFFGLMGSPEKVIDFDSVPLGKMPPGWTAEVTNGPVAPPWQVVRDTSAPTQPFVLAQVSNGPANRSPLAILDTMAVRDGDVSVRVKSLAGRPEQTGGVIVRYHDPNNYYYARADALTHTIGLFKVQNGQTYRVAADVRHDVPANAWCILKVAVRGAKFQVYVNHRRLLQAQDATFLGAGKVGLWTRADSSTYFDDFRVSPK